MRILVLARRKVAASCHQAASLMPAVLDLVVLVLVLVLVQARRDLAQALAQGHALPLAPDDRVHVRGQGQVQEVGQDRGLDHGNQGHDPRLDQGRDQGLSQGPVLAQDPGQEVDPQSQEEADHILAPRPLLGQEDHQSQEEVDHILAPRPLLGQEDHQLDQGAEVEMNLREKIDLLDRLNGC